MSLRKRVLIVDDEEDLTWTLNKKFSKDVDKFELLIASNGKEALQVLSQLPVNVVVSDIRMPEVNGLDLLLEIKKHYASTKVIMMTAYGSPEIRSQAVKNGCLYYIEKPFEIEELRSLILEALSEQKGFAGMVSDFQLSDLIQVNCLGHLTAELYVRHDNEEGIIYFHDGNIVHAEVGTLKGEEAFYRIISWPGGEFSVKKNAKSHQHTINKSWQNLLLEGLRLKDEASKMYEDERENEKQKRIIMMQNELSKLLRVNGVLGVFVFNKGGFPLTSVADNDKNEQDPETLGSNLDDIFASVEKFKDDLKANSLKMLMMEFEKYLILAFTIPSKSEYLAVLADANTNQGLLRLEIRKILDDIIKLI